MLKIRLRRMGAIRQPHYRIVVADARAPRDGAFIDLLGHYNPLTNPATIQVDVTKYEDWKKKGAQPTNAVASLVKLFNRAQKAQAASEPGTSTKASTLTRTASGKRSTRATAAPAPVAEAEVEAAPVAEAEAEATPVAEAEAEAAPVAEAEAEAAPVAEVEAEAAPLAEEAATATEEAAATTEETTEETPA